MKRRLLWLSAGLIVVSSLQADEGHHHADAKEKLGTVSFAISCALPEQKSIERGIALLHSFWFDEAQKQFEEAVQKDPKCAMAYWAEAMGLYAHLAPAPPHALHMPSIIFARLGLWHDDIDSNLAALEAARHPVAMHVGAENQVHAMEFLEYAYLQTGDDHLAEQMVGEQAAIGYDQVDKNLVDYLDRTHASSPAMYFLEMRHWKEAADLKPDMRAQPYNQAVTYWAHAAAAGHLRDAAAARDAVRQFDAMVEATKRGAHAFRAQYLEVKHDEAAAWLAFTEDRNDEA